MRKDVEILVKPRKSCTTLTSSNNYVIDGGSDHRGPKCW